MSDSPRLVLLVDHDNMRFSTDKPLRGLLTSWLRAIASSFKSSPVDIRVRAYGGWFQENRATDSRFSAADFYQANCPAVFRHDGYACRVSFEFADALLTLTHHGDAQLVTHTVASRPAAQWVRTRGETACGEANCDLKAVRRWISRGHACMRAACPHAFADCFERREQKQVDVHIATDLLLASRILPISSHVALASDDWDFLPAIAALGLAPGNLETITVLRSLQSPTYIDDELRARGVRLINWTGD